nr:DNA-processing protein DprA [Lacticaseibacillus absianus]
MHTKAWETEATLWQIIVARQLGPDDDASQLADWPGVAPLQIAWTDPEWRHTAHQLYRRQPVLTRLDPQYPLRLQESSQPPLVLFFAGRLGLLERLALAVVGARQASRYTREALISLGRDLPALVIVSGLAAGADTFAHQYALSREWPTIAVLANGLDQVYPARNVELQARIGQVGLLLSEYPPGVTPQPFRFVARNRIIAGLVHGVLVTEAAAHSGSLITANFALQNGREVFAVPNQLDAPLGVGTNALIQAGAKLVQRSADIAEELRFYH